MANGYRKLDLIGAGTFGKVWLVHRKANNKKYVIKEVAVTGLSEKERSQSITEIKALALCKHLNVIRYKEAFVTDAGMLSIVMEYATGGDMQQKIEGQHGAHFREEVILEWFTQISFAIKYIHQQNILHRDLKTQNIFLSQHNLVKVGDFGIAKVLQNTQDHACTAIGTPYYLSPEICQQQPYNQRSDMWSLGCVLYELCSLAQPFKAPTLGELVVCIVQCQYQPIPSQYGQLLVDLVSVLLRSDPASRPTAEQLLAIPAMEIHIENYVQRAQGLREKYLSPHTPSPLGMCRSSSPFRKSQEVGSDKENVNPLGSGKKPHPGSWVSPGLSPLAQYSNRGCTSAKENPEERPTKPQTLIPASPKASLFRDVVHKKHAAEISNKAARPRSCSPPVGHRRGSPKIECPPPVKSVQPSCILSHTYSVQWGHAVCSTKPVAQEPGKIVILQQENSKEQTGQQTTGKGVINTECTITKNGSKPKSLERFDHLYQSCFETPSDIHSKIETLMAFLESKLGTDTVHEAIQKVTASIVKGTVYSHVEDSLHGDAMEYFPLIMQIIQLEKFAGYIHMIQADHPDTYQSR